MQLDIHAPSCNLAQLVGSHQMQHAKAHDFCVVYAQVAGYTGSELILLRNAVVVLAGIVDKSINRPPAVLFFGQVENTRSLICADVDPPGSSPPEDITQHQIEDRIEVI